MINFFELHDTSSESFPYLDPSLLPPSNIEKLNRTSSPKGDHVYYNQNIAAQFRH
jgi:hypothetical protein